MNPVDAFRSALETSDPAPAVATFADDVVLHSPAVISKEYAGPELAGQIIGFAAKVLTDVRFTDELHNADGTTHALVLEASVGAERAQGVLYLQTAGEQLKSVTFLLRPLRAMAAFVDAMGAHGAQPALDYTAGTQ
jgi:hypothetical protein